MARALWLWLVWLVLLRPCLQEEVKPAEPSNCYQIHSADGSVHDVGEFLEPVSRWIASGARPGEAGFGLESLAGNAGIDAVRGDANSPQCIAEGVAIVVASCLYVAQPDCVIPWHGFVEPWEYLVRSRRWCVILGFSNQCCCHCL
ncbi:unnamed protein product [Effrenium voratum]|uniref:Uncharacterized protein n=1 Tax=Effrenium voratum TaxID=2562239 RepID=A0AA36NJU8_9DINO|nr:unnamed protein product [Effrenium voratum]CAJ1409999.1 unnamed protein product [Effrenium voratum]CAJ1439843.1 unnamed protein product [Effrenium voratum]